MIQIIEHENGYFSVLEGGVLRCTAPIESTLRFLNRLAVSRREKPKPRLTLIEGGGE